MQDIQYPLKIERDIATVCLSKTIASIKASQQTRTTSIKHLSEFKEYYTRVLNFTISDSKMSSAKYKKFNLIPIAVKVRDTRTTLENIDYQCKVAERYIDALFSSGILDMK